MPSYDFALSRGPRPFAAIFVHPLRSEIDERLFVRHQKVARVHQWLDEVSDVKVSYATLNRYRKWRISEGMRENSDLRSAEVRKDLAYLEEIVRLSRSTLDAGVLVRPSEAMRAVELRANLLERFPDASGEREARHESELRRLADAVKSVVSEDQLRLIREAIQRGAP